MKAFEKLKAKAKERAKLAATRAKDVAKAAVKKEVARQKAARKARKTAWMCDNDGHYYKALGDGTYVHVVGAKAYLADRNLNEATQITGTEGADYVRSAKATKAVREVGDAIERVPAPKKAAPKKAAPKKAAPKKAAPKKAAPKKAAPKKAAPKKRAAPKKKAAPKMVGGMAWRGY